MKQELPRGKNVRWCVRRKLMVVRAIENGTITFEDACARYDLTHEELDRWNALLKSGGKAALRATRVQDYRGEK